ncbi:MULTISPECIES: DUF3421 domain-containing protein [unclassified Legionella]|uniref:DUF3421 domain-containing protein n=1 Tax=unclassified Legionella TaxID=2622702 RepID=UPI001054A679|nr:MULTISPECIES: DUF3421 domain-containing protein [unclassified Legionella]MDI9819373.1 DUF3421 domain-containing protein [Legionella sp. PL877]
MRTACIMLVVFSLQSTWASNTYYHQQYNSLNNALRTGTDTNGKPLYLCTARLFNSTQPGKTWEGYGRCNVPYGGKEYIVDKFEVPLKDRFRGSYWQNNGGMAMPVGQEADGTPLFLCQVFFKGSKQPGKTWPGYNHCNISYAGQEIITDNYQVLTKERAGRHHHRHQAEQQCIHGRFGQMACGYNCIQSINRVGCASSPDQQCLADNFGTITCGYGCVKTPLKVICANRRSENCVINNYNESRCGKNCRIDRFNRIQCN